MNDSTLPNREVRRPTTSDFSDTALNFRSRLQTIAHGERVQLNVRVDRRPVGRHEALAFMAMSNHMVG